ncbi:MULTISPECIES: hypothetical protein [Pseudoalteromonas]|uniref:hypothetical protein n=1 Tax=Pseudoalteromonas TaxID=53246 RepID=UPI00029A6A0E|nr:MULTISPECIES: hypothetical protein [Pseudoalteromonas]AUJ68802.1 hypothetical protein PNC201_02325 [Pseudoalteromonas sp. NC201]MBR8843204.1 hypothetical protein [Pseudoalteromonas sp. JC3]MCF2825776.1 hypothetical protein [Pseudoalteromonas sp. OF5H-5]MCF2832941.1 hypothetical protein [Pseudoalteromonas sp. DL2-H6]MCF2923664.1 hypothetical protein [Pseudoalteromonas sp. DL2-H1]
MKLHLTKKSIKNLSRDNKTLPVKATPAIGGGFVTHNCNLNSIDCDRPTTYTLSIEICNTDRPEM